MWKLLHYPEGRLHEDDFVAHRLFWRCDKVVCLPDVLYIYRLRSGSIMRTSLKPGAFDAVDGLAEMCIRDRDKHHAYFIYTG